MHWGTVARLNARALLRIRSIMTNAIKENMTFNKVSIIITFWLYIIHCQVQYRATSMKHSTPQGGRLVLVRQEPGDGVTPPVPLSERSVNNRGLWKWNQSFAHQHCLFLSDRHLWHEASPCDWLDSCFRVFQSNSSKNTPSQRGGLNANGKDRRCGNSKAQSNPGQWVHGEAGSEEDLVVVISVAVQHNYGDPAGDTNKRGHSQRCYSI